MVKLLIYGVGGKMGREVLKACKADPAVQAVAAVDPYCNDIDEIPVYTNIDDVAEAFDCIIDFSVKDSIYNFLPYATMHKIPCVLATTGYTPQDETYIKESSEEIALFRSGNMSLGINVLMGLVKEAAKALSGFADIEIVETHHNQKVDAPSGTALMLRDAAVEGAGAKRSVYGRHGLVGKRTKEEIGIHAVRGGTVVGKHDVMLLMNNEVITLSHTAESKSVFALGAINAAKWLVKQPAGLYNMHDLLG